MGYVIEGHTVYIKKKWGARSLHHRPDKGRERDSLSRPRLNVGRRPVTKSSIDCLKAVLGFVVLSFFVFFCPGLETWGRMNDS